MGIKAKFKKIKNKSRRFAVKIKNNTCFKYYYKYDIEKFCKLGEIVFNLHMEDKNEMALATIHKIEEYFKALGMPSTLAELGIKEDDIDALVDNMTDGGTKVVPHHGKDMDAEVARIIYNSCMR